MRSCAFGTRRRAFDRGAGERSRRGLERGRRRRARDTRAARGRLRRRGRHRGRCPPRAGPRAGACERDASPMGARPARVKGGKAKAARAATLGTQIVALTRIEADRPEVRGLLRGIRSGRISAPLSRSWPTRRGAGAQTEFPSAARMDRLVPTTCVSRTSKRYFTGIRARRFQRKATRGLLTGSPVPSSMAWFDTERS